MPKTVVAYLDPPHCPYCGSKLDAHHGNDIPGDGDLAFCVYCFQMSIFSVEPGALKLRKPATKQEKDDCKEAKRDLLGPLPA